AVVKPEPLTKTSQPDLVRAAEGDRILRRIKGSGFSVALDVSGRSLSSEELANQLGRWEKSGLNRLTFVIGGPLGLGQKVLMRVEDVLSLSRLTFSHELCLLVGLEQLYRALALRAGRPYAR
ncbi:MAG: 23S rRNA (pseudouridine(1915)-N(3))-methyltransferase RlmH, partial [Deltaproteobacteria bacterium]|nr:23S rRNA (pseudouridine(1915)-N(3))-methyltransferase RlmH [Deltaproteobacteria bacterium]